MVEKKGELNDFLRNLGNVYRGCKSRNSGGGNSQGRDNGRFNDFLQSIVIERVF